MKTLSSSDFRKVYARLVEPVMVTVNGHAIGVWTPPPEESSGAPAVRPPAVRLSARDAQKQRDEWLRKAVK